MILLTTKEMIEKLKVSRTTLYLWRKKGLPFKRIGTQIRYDVHEVEEWIEENNMFDNAQK